ncbi:Uncharacterised protein [Leclercia adecarboxylata]|nr:Uncharacterised protein [Leclercia adecarboxylata]
MQADGRTFAHCKQPFNTGFTLLIGFDTAHGVVRGWAYRNRIFDRIDAHIRFRQFANEGQTFQQLLLTQVAQVEIDHIAAWGWDGVAFTPLVPERL